MSAAAPPFKIVSVRREVTLAGEVTPWDTPEHPWETPAGSGRPSKAPSFSGSSQNSSAGSKGRSRSCVEYIEPKGERANPLRNLKMTVPFVIQNDYVTYNLVLGR